MKKLTSLQIMMLMSLALGSSYISADYSEKSNKYHKSHKRQNRDHKASQAVVMNEEEMMAMESVVSEAQARMEKEMGKVPTEHSIKKFIHSVVEDFRMSNKDEDAVERAQFKLSDAQIAIERFSDKLESVDKHRMASAHTHSLNRKLRNARTYIKDHAKRNAESQLNREVMSDEPMMMNEPMDESMMDNQSMMNDDSNDSDDVIVQNVVYGGGGYG